MQVDPMGHSPSHILFSWDVIKRYFPRRDLRFGDFPFRQADRHPPRAEHRARSDQRLWFRDRRRQNCMVRFRKPPFCQVWVQFGRPSFETGVAERALNLGALERECLDAPEDVGYVLHGVHVL